MRGVLAAVLLVAAAPAAAQSPDETWKLCFGPTTERTVWACTTIIDANDTTAKNIAIARFAGPRIPPRIVGCLWIRERILRISVNLYLRRDHPYAA